MPKVFPASFGLPFRHKIKKLLFSETLSTYKGFLRPFHPSSGRHKSQDFRSEVGIFRFKRSTLVRGHCASSLKACREKGQFWGTGREKKDTIFYGMWIELPIVDPLPPLPSLTLQFICDLWLFFEREFHDLLFIFFRFHFEHETTFSLVGLESRDFFHFDSP